MTFDASKKIQIVIAKSLTYPQSKSGELWFLNLITHLACWSSQSLAVELPLQEALVGRDRDISVAFTAYNNLGDLMTAESQVR